VNQYRLTLRPTDEDSLYPTDEVISFWDKEHYPEPYERLLSQRSDGLEAGISAGRADRIADWVRYWLGLCRVYHVHDTSRSSPMRKTSQINDNEFLKPDGSNLAAFLYRLQQSDSASYTLIKRSVRRVAPFFDDFLLRPDPLNSESIRLEWKHRESDAYFGPATFSDGTLRFIALATLFLQPVELRPSLILVDEPELGLHPYAIALLSSLVKQASKESQVILSTQSASLLDHFEPEDVLVASLDANGTRLSRLETSDLGEWLEDYSLGQLWEKNEFGGRPG
jgi:predicted ATPase